MRYDITAPPLYRVVDWEFAKYHCRLTASDEEGTGSGQDEITERSYVESLIDAATEYALDAMACSLIKQTITAVFYRDDAPQLSGFFTGNNQAFSNLRPPLLFLPRGPVLAVDSVIDAKGKTPNYAVERVGNSDRIRLHSNVEHPITVIYSAGFGESPTDVPANLRHAIATHVGTLYEQRESALEGNIAVVPHSLDAFYKLRRRDTGIG